MKNEEYDELVNQVPFLLNFNTVSPENVEKVESNCGTTWFTDKATGQRYYMTIQPCCSDEEFDQEDTEEELVDE